MNCEQVQSLLVAYLDGEVTPSERTLIQAHLSNCTVCQQELTLLSTARSQVRSMLQRQAVHAGQYRSTPARAHINHPRSPRWLNAAIVRSDAEQADASLRPIVVDVREAPPLLHDGERAPVRA